MPNVLCFAAPRRRPQRGFFSRRELNQLLSLYSRRVMAGDWRDYAIDHRDGMAMFSIFRHSFDRSVYVMAPSARLPAATASQDIPQNP